VVFDGNVLTLDIASVLEPEAERAHTMRDRINRSGVEEPNDRHRWLLCACRQRPRRRAAEQRDELASLPWTGLHPMHLTG
jgi:hypothetical protein